jgi:hypothetical protein
VVGKWTKSPRDAAVSEKLTGQAMSAAVQALQKAAESRSEHPGKGKRTDK